ncbi:hypothetical protein ANN_18842 [Periplaneta americana]|uniref:Uncharacterized protein n=1 Tax=Periplaneta americana TaxID=6978 RepID=A0ABQ8SPV9_PERAM|nr:hypothetical protein ANN_18842 [Periplaneta americana]
MKKIREEAGQRKAMSMVVEERQLKWYGHVKRMGEERKAEQVFEMRMEERYGRGSPRTAWEDKIERIGQKRGKTVGELKRLSNNRQEWQRWIDQAPDRGERVCANTALTSNPRCRPLAGLERSVCLATRQVDAILSNPLTKPGVRIPNRSTIHDLVNKVRSTESFLNKKHVQQRRVLTEEKLDEVGARLEDSPRKSLRRRRLAQEVNISKTSAFVATKLLKLKPYRVTVVHALQPQDPEEENELVGSLAEKKLPTEGCTGRNGERKKSSG